MARPLRLQIPGLVYHVMARGNARQDIFLDAPDHRRFLNILGSVVEEHALRCWAYCLMPNHYHLVVQTSSANLSGAMRQLNGVYAQWWNRRHERVGHVTQGRFKAQVVQPHRYLLAVCRYVMLNPVRAALTHDPADWPWSSCGATLGKTRPPSFLATALLLEACGGGSDIGRQRRAVAQLLGRADPLEVGSAVRSDQRIIGDDEFIEGFRGDAARESREVPQRERAFGGARAQSLLADMFVRERADIGGPQAESDREQLGRQR